MSAPDGFDQLRKMRDAGEDLPPLDPAGDPGPDADAHGRGGQNDDDDGTDRLKPLPDDCPVVPLGVSGDACHYLDAIGQHREVKARDHTHLNLRHMFGTRSRLLYKHWPRLTKIVETDAQGNQTERWETTGFRPELVAEDLMGAAAQKGPWSPQDRIRGVGAWLGSEGELILHGGDFMRIVDVNAREELHGDSALTPWREIKPGVIERFVYPSAPPGLTPAMEHQPAGDQGPAAKLLRLFQTWHWKRPDLDPYLLLGWVCSAMLGGALPWRATAWLTGSTATGKSTLQNAIKWLFGHGGLLKSPDATAAAIRQIVKHASMPVALDEQEAEEGDNRKVNQLIRLARDAATGEIAIRGGNDHSAATFTLRNSFLFSSILIPSLLPQDRNRMAVLELKVLPAGAARPRITERGMGAVGTRLMRRLVQQWPRALDTIESYREMLSEVGFPARGQDVFGTLLACADLALHDHVTDTDSLAAMKDKMAAALERERAGGGDDSSSCLSHLLSTALEDPQNRKRGTIGWWVGRAAGHHFLDEQTDPPTVDDQKRANAVLQPNGLRVVEHPKGSGLMWLAIANQHVGLSKLYAGSMWCARSGADGVWKQSLGRLAHSEDQINVQIWFGSNARATLLPIDICLPAGDSPPKQQGSAAGLGDDLAPSAGIASHSSASGAPGHHTARSAADADQTTFGEGGGQPTEAETWDR